jgi:hypothetical protein
MPASWPSSLPVYVLEQGYAEKLPEQTIETQVDAGIAKVRRRYTAANRMFNITLQLSNAQAETFETFYESTLAGGSLPFDWRHPRYGTAVTFRFRKPAPQHSPIGGEYVRTSFVLEQIG